MNQSIISGPNLTPNATERSEAIARQGHPFFACEKPAFSEWGFSPAEEKAHLRGPVAPPRNPVFGTPKIRAKTDLIKLV